MGMSGGIDSTVSAMLLLEQGYEVVGVTYRVYDSIKESCMLREKGCCSVESIMEARDNARRMGFEHHIVDFRDVFKEQVISNFCDEYMHGRTPNPCVLCNSHIKWGEMCRTADELGCDYIATGHYARIGEHNDHLYLRAAEDDKKDQTYFLWMITEENIRRTIFPLGDLTKPEVREIARQHGFEKVAEKAESQEICFVTDNDYRRFLRETVADYSERVRPGDYVDASGRMLGRHEGFCNYTIGQRKGLGIALGTPAYVTKIDADRNEVTLGSNDDLMKRSLLCNHLRIRDVQWLTEDPVVEARIRYKSKPQKARLEILSGGEWSKADGTARIVFDEAVWGITPGQSVVLYKDGLLVGGGIISSAEN
ncbi:MAG: tRNA 2-thiouridine(34) synthase MnmA [Bacteroidales bacterium]|nr:tRNA 2-thiouridine(34) synthase MnmA [Candidatus Colicola faecequi]